MFKRKKKKEKREDRIMRELEEMSDEEFLEKYKHYNKMSLATGIGSTVATVVIMILTFIFLIYQNK